MTPEEMQKLIHEHFAEFKKFHGETVLKIVGIEAVNHYTKSFVNEGFEDTTIKKWPDVKRRDPASEWYGFSYRSDSAKPGTSKGKKGEVKKGLTNFSPEATKNKILTGTADLKNSIHYVIKPDRVTVGTDKPYAAVHQFGMPAKVFGKAGFVMKPRPFIGKSEVLNNAIREKIVKELTRIFEPEIK